MSQPVTNCACGKSLPPRRGKGAPHRLCLDCKDTKSNTAARERMRRKAAEKRAEKEPAPETYGLSPVQVAELNRLRATGWSYQGLAKRYGISEGNVRALLGGKG